MNPEAQRAVFDLIKGQRWASLATLEVQGHPFASKVAYAAENDLGGLVLHLSRLARHTTNLLARPTASVVIGEPDLGGDDPQTLARVTLQGLAQSISADAADYPALRALYVQRLPSSAPRFEFSDFVLFRFVPSRAHFVGGFARAFELDVDELRAAAATSRDSPQGDPSGG